MRQIFEMAIAEGHIRLNPAALLFTPKNALKPTRLVMTAGKTDSEIGVTHRYASGRDLWANVGATSGSICGSNAAFVPGKIDTPKTDHSVRKAALTDGVWRDLESWRSSLRDQRVGAFVFPSERGTALSKDNVWRRNMHRNWKRLGLGGATSR